MVLAYLCSVVHSATPSSMIRGIEIIMAIINIHTLITCSNDKDVVNRRKLYCHTKTSGLKKLCFPML